MEFLTKFGYKKSMSLEQCLTYLRERFQYICAHEIGVFLGYPLEDVITYVECPTASCKVIGYWKVYHNETAARSVFNKFNALKYQVISRIIKGENPKEILRNSCKTIDLLSCLVDSTGVSF